MGGILRITTADEVEASAAGKNGKEDSYATRCIVVKKKCRIHSYTTYINK